MYAALLLVNKELLEMQREKQDSKELHHLNTMLGSSLALWGRDAGLPMDNVPSQYAEVILNGKVVSKDWRTYLRLTSPEQSEEKVQFDFSFTGRILGGGGH